MFALFIYLFIYLWPGLVQDSLELFIANNSEVCLRRTSVMRKNKAIMRSTVMGLQTTSALL